MVSFTDYYNAISIDRVPSKTKTGKDSSKRFMKIEVRVLLSCKDFSFIESTQKKTLQHVAGGNTSNTVLKRLLWFFLKAPPLKKILQFQERIFFIKNTKATSSVSFWWWNTKPSLKERKKFFLKVPPLK